MRFRLSGREVRSLYDTGVSRGIPADVIDAFFGVLEAIEAAPVEADLRALRSLSFVSNRSGGLRWTLRSGFWLVGRRVNEKGATVFVIDEIHSPEKGELGA